MTTSSDRDQEGTSILELGNLILHECLEMDRQCKKDEIPLPSMLPGTSTAFWSDTASIIAQSRTKALGLLERLTTLLQGPHDFLHEFVASNWDHGALYTFLQSPILEYLVSTGGYASLFNLAEVSNIPEDKLTRILALLRCKNILHEPQIGVFSLTAVSEELARDENFRAWVEFQLFETRVASAHLAHTLAQKKNEYGSGISAFKQGWGSEMYEWHTSHPEKGERFCRAMKGVSTSLDPADSLLRLHLPKTPFQDTMRIVEIGGRYGFASINLFKERPDLEFEIRCESQQFLNQGKELVDTSSLDRITFSGIHSLLDPPPARDSTNVTTYIVRNIFWNWTDSDAIKLLRVLLPTLRGSPHASILVTDGVSPEPKQFPQHVEIAYRRRDITTMTMHNVKQRTQREWLQLYSSVDPALSVRSDIKTSAHVCKGLWQLSLEAVE